MAEKCKCDLCLWNQGSGSGGGGGGAGMFVTLGTISAATVPMTYDGENERWHSLITTDIPVPSSGMCAGRNLTLTVDGNTYSIDVIGDSLTSIDDAGDTEVRLVLVPGASIALVLLNYETDAPVITNLSTEVYTASPELAVLLPPSPK